MSNDDYLELNRTNWDARAVVHVEHFGFGKSEESRGLAERAGARVEPVWANVYCAFEALGAHLRPRLHGHEGDLLYCEFDASLELTALKKHDSDPSRPCPA